MAGIGTIPDETIARTAGGVRWHWRAEATDLWPTDESWPVAGWLSRGDARIIKKGSHRTVVHVELPSCSFYLKQHHLPDRISWLRQCLRPAKARREFEYLLELRRRGVPVPEPLGWGERSGPFGIGESFLVTRALNDVSPLNLFLRENQQLQPRDRHILAHELGRFVAIMHEAGVRHDDFHLGNILTSHQNGRFSFTLVDLDAVTLGGSLDKPRSLANLAILGSSFSLITTRSDRLRFLTSYVQARGWLDVPTDLKGPRAIFHWARELEDKIWTYNLAFWARRDDRCLRGNRYYQSVRADDLVGQAVRGLDEDWLARLVQNPDALFQGSGVKILKHSKSSTVAEIPAPGDGLPLILKKIAVTRGSDPWVSLLRPTPVLRSWISGQGFLERALPTPRPLVMLHRLRTGMLHEGYLVTEKLENVQELDAYVRGLEMLPTGEQRRRLLRQIERVARAIREMHRRNISHRDLKAANLLVTSAHAEDAPAVARTTIATPALAVPPTHLWFIDLVGVTRLKSIGRRRRVQNLARLNTSFLGSPQITHTDRLRFLRIYLAWGIHGKGNWKAWWQAITAATAQKVARNQKSGRALG